MYMRTQRALAVGVSVIRIGKIGQNAQEMNFLYSAISLTLALPHGNTSRYYIVQMGCDVVTQSYMYLEVLYYTGKFW